jgi:hypothetical protein
MKTMSIKASSCSASMLAGKRRLCSGGPPMNPEALAVPEGNSVDDQRVFLINDDHHPPGGTNLQSFTTDMMKATAI